MFNFNLSTIKLHCQEQVFGKSWNSYIYEQLTPYPCWI